MNGTPVDYPTYARSNWTRHSENYGSSVADENLRSTTRELEEWKRKAFEATRELGVKEESFFTRLKALQLAYEITAGADIKNEDFKGQIKTLERDSKALACRQSRLEKQLENVERQSKSLKKEKYKLKGRWKRLNRSSTRLKKQNSKMKQEVDNYKGQSALLSSLNSNVINASKDTSESPPAGQGANITRQKCSTPELLSTTAPTEVDGDDDDDDDEAETHTSLDKDNLTTVTINLQMNLDSGNRIRKSITGSHKPTDHLPNGDVFQTQKSNQKCCVLQPNSFYLRSGSAKSNDPNHGITT